MKKTINIEHEDGAIVLQSEECKYYRRVHTADELMKELLRFDEMYVTWKARVDLFKMGRKAHINAWDELVFEGKTYFTDDQIEALMKKVLGE